MRKEFNQLRIGWFCPTNGDMTRFSDPGAIIPRSLEHFIKVNKNAEDAGMEYMLFPTGPTCWDAWTAASFVAAACKKIKPLVAMKPGFTHPVAQAKMIAAFSNFTQGRIHINLIAGVSEKEAVSEGQLGSKEARYRQLEEEVVLIKRLLTEKNVTFDGEFYQVKEPAVIPDLEYGMPEFFLGGGSDQAIGISARHSAVHLFWGDYPAVISEQIKAIKQIAAEYQREQDLAYAMRLQVICRETEDEAWDFAHQLVADTEQRKAEKKQRDQNINSVANARQKELAKVEGGKMTPHLWTGINDVRVGAGVAVVGNPKQVAAQLMEFVEAGCSGFCLSGYPHDKEAEIFGRLVMPLLRQHVERMSRHDSLSV
ncbi:LLM class flavin-dependent oxidoreductase [Pusillimonas sp. SM2304]|uniref:LLM class flavin-dependent oxidoreductase n=1 Tax=Pusillimonas sp. SM2304 TaxID=3073241 RepID=UPI0028771527|nr:LLM class flavin-dependent oxidoreductase [Pusillimonas sp. SM2304]MDS1139905.1 LLM class flavin-dependent oxidoreductase [Pusillimonas sp. SM2304]